MVLKNPFVINQTEDGKVKINYKNMRNTMKYYSLTLITLFIVITSSCKTNVVVISDEVKENIKFRVDNGINTGIVVGLITSDGASFFSYGVKSKKTNELVDEISVFEIGSISKTFTGLLLADMAVKGVLNLDDPLQDHLPNGVTAPKRNGESIKLFHLSNHTSSLPRLPENMIPMNPGNPYADYSEKQLYDFLNGYTLTRDIGSLYEYSNYAAGLLGNLLAVKKKMTYEALMVEVIANSLGMQNTRIVFTPQMMEHLAMGHNNGIEVSNWDLPTLAGAGAIRSTAVDMLKYVSANAGIEDSDQYPAMQLAHKNSRGEDSNPQVGLGWHVMHNDGIEIIWHNGGTGGYRAFAGFVKGGKVGVVVLTNSTASVDDIGIHLLQPTSALNNPKPSIAIKIKAIFENDGIAAATKKYWELKKNKSEEFDFGENHLNSLGYSYLQDGNINKAISIFELNVQAFPVSSNVYDSYGEALLKNNENEKAISNYKKSVELNPGNTNAIQVLKDLGEDSDSLTKEVTVADAILESYVGKYELAPGFVLTVIKYESQLKVQATGQGENAIYPNSENVFYLKVVNAQLTFNSNEEGEVQSVTLLQGGMETTGKKMKD